MNTSLMWKFALIFVIVAGAAWLVYPPEENINYGLDLAGGVHILMQVNTDSSIEYERNQVQSWIGQALTEAGITYEAIPSVDSYTLEVQGVPADRADEADDIIRNLVASWTVSDIGSGAWRIVMPQPFRAAISAQAVDQTLETLRKRVDGLGVKEPLIQKQGLQGDRILIQLPGVEDIIEVHDVLGETALLEWKELTYPPGVDPRAFGPASSEESVIAQFGGVLPADTELFPEDRENAAGEFVGTVYWPLKSVSTVIGSDIKNARRVADEWGDAAVSFELTQEAAKRFSVATQANIGRPMAIVLDKRVLSTPVIQGQIFDRGQITGQFSVQDAEKLALQLRSGALPVEINVIEERTVGPSLGRDSIKAGVSAAGVGFIGVLIFMVVYYRMAGINAVVALSLNLLLVLAAMSYFDATLTLPGIAGLVLVVGMAVDSNVLIFERIREELGVGKTVRSAVQQGFGRAWMTILDCNVTTLVAAFFLFSYGTGPVKGFAVTLTIGLLASMFTAVFVSRQLFELMLGRKRRVESLSI